MKKLVFFLLFTSIVTTCYTQTINIENIEGVWSRRQLSDLNNSAEQEFSWEERIFPFWYDMLIDLTSIPPTIEFFGYTSPDTVTNTSVKNNIIELTFFFGMGRFYATLVCHFNEDGTMWIEEIRSPDLSFAPLGNDNIGKGVIYYKIAGP